MTVTRVAFPGSFDPLTLGHCDIVERALTIFDELLIGIVANPAKEPLFTVAERQALIEQTFKSYGKRVVVLGFSGLLVDFLKREQVRVVIRGLRAISDYDYETQMALMNKSLASDVETFFLPTREKFSYVSSTLVKQVAKLGGDVSALVPSNVAVALKSKFSNKS